MTQTGLAGVTTLTYDGANQVRTSTVAVGTTTYTHDASGNLVEIEYPTESRVYAWDAEHRLILATQPSLGVFTYVYNADGQRVLRATSATSESIRYNWDLNNPLVITDESNVTQNLFDWQPRFFGNLLNKHDPAAHGYLFDAFGAVRQITDNTGEVVESYDYNAFGGLIEGNPFRFGGQFGAMYESPLGIYLPAGIAPSIGQSIAGNGFSPFGLSLNSMFGNPYPCPKCEELKRQMRDRVLQQISDFGSSAWQKVTQTDWLDASASFSAGFADIVTFGGVTKLNEYLWGDIAKRNHEGTAFRLGQAAGVAHSVALGYGGARASATAARWAVNGAKYYSRSGDAVGVAQSVYVIYNKQFGLSSVLGFLPAAGYGLGALRSTTATATASSRNITRFSKSGKGSQGKSFMDWLSFDRDASAETVFHEVSNRTFLGPKYTATITNNNTPGTFGYWDRQVHERFHEMIGRYLPIISDAGDYKIGGIPIGAPIKYLEETAAYVVGHTALGRLHGTFFAPIEAFRSLDKPYEKVVASWAISFGVSGYIACQD